MLPSIVTMEGGLMNNFILKMTEQAKGLDLHVLRISFFLDMNIDLNEDVLLNENQVIYHKLRIQIEMLDDSHILNY